MDAAPGRTPLLRALAAALLLCLPACLASGKAEPGGSALGAALERAVAVQALRGAQVGVLIVRSDDGRTLFERNPDRALTPASNQKVLTALAVLDAFGPAHRFTTELLADRLPDAEGDIGTLYVRGGGDPSMTSEQCWRLAADLRRLGVRKVAGLVLDASLFDDQRWHPAWAPLSARAYHAPIAGLSVNYGAFTVVARAAGPVGSPLRVAIDPPVPYLALDLNAHTTGGRGKPLAVERAGQGASERVSVRGTLRAGRAPEVVNRSVSDPILYFGAVLRMQLAAVGIAVAEPVRAAPVPPGAVALHRFRGDSVAEIVRLLMKYSSNPIAETLVKQLGVLESGAPGSWATGIAGIERRLTAHGIDVSGAQLVDGSGLATRNRVSPRVFVSALRAALLSFRYGAEFRAALPIGATDGTLKKRVAAAGAQVRAKTGFLTGAIGLSGIAVTRGGEEALFSILVNGYRGGDRETMRAVDGVVAALVAGSLDGAP